MGNIFSDPGFMPHIHCYLDRPALVWTMMLTDLLIGLAYVAISLTLLALIRKIKLPFSLVVICFGFFIGACGATHFMEVWTLWHPDYWWAAFLKIITAIASVGTGIYLFQLRHPLVAVAEAAKLAEQRKIKLEEMTTSLERKVMERTHDFEEGEVRLRTLIESLPQLVWSCLPNGQCDYLSRQWIDYTGVSLQDQLGLDWLGRVIHPDDQARTLEHWIGAVKGLHSYDIEYRIRRKDGVYRWFKTRGMPVKNNQNQISHWFGTCTDVQDQLEIRQQLEDTVRARDEFLSIASHELKTPLTSLKLQTQLVQRSIKKGDPSVYTKPKVDYLTEQTDKQIGRLARLVDDMLDIARIRAGRLTLQRSQVDLVELVKGCIERMEPQFLSGKLSQPLLTVSGGTCEGNWDAVRIEQVMNNLFTNAIRYGEGTPINVTVSHEAGIARVTVKDGGIGIALEAQDKIFDRFERAVDANEVSGLGLGLFITRQIVDAHNGKVSVISTLGEGATFTVELPINCVIEEDLKNGT
jgi:PAS domain S-box-containing protein